MGEAQTIIPNSYMEDTSLIICLGEYGRSSYKPNIRSALILNDLNVQARRILHAGAWVDGNIGCH